MVWPPDYVVEEDRRNQVQAIINSTPDPRDTAKELYQADCTRFINDCCVTYDPRNPSRGLPAKMPFIPFPRQVELVDFILSSMRDEESGMIEKSRDMGATWICSAISVWLWIFSPGSSVGWGSRKEQLVDRLGDPDSIFEKIRMIIRHLPWYVVPEGFTEKNNSHYMKCVNPDNGSTITGEAGDNIGRGGRKSIYFVDEAAHLDRPELIEAALGDNTNCQIDISSVCGEGTVFHRKRLSGAVGVFVMDWRDHPAKNDEWYDKRREQAEAKGLLHLFAQEVDRDYSAAVEGIFIPSEWVKACIDAHVKLGIQPVGSRRVGLDIADEGADKNAMVDSYGGLVSHIDQWAEGDTGVTAIKGWNYCVENEINELIYDSIGVGSGVKAKTNELQKMPENQHLSINVRGFNAGGKVAYPDEEYIEGRLNKDMFAGIKAQAWWIIRDHFHSTYLAITKGEEIPFDKIISIPSDLPYREELVSELSRPKIEYDSAGRVVVESKKKMKKRGINSPNIADALVMCYAPDPEPDYDDLMQLAIGANQ